MQPQVQVPVRLPGQQQQPWSTPYPKFNHNPTLIPNPNPDPNSYFLNIFLQNLAKYANAYANLIMNIHRIASLLFTDMF